MPIAHHQHTATQSVVGDRLEARPSLSHALQCTLKQRTALHVEDDAAAIEKHAELQVCFIVSFWIRLRIRIRFRIRLNLG